MFIHLMQEFVCVCVLYGCVQVQYVLIIAEIDKIACKSEIRAFVYSIEKKFCRCARLCTTEYTAVHPFL